MPAAPLSSTVLELENRIPLVISRGVRSRSQALWVRIAAEGIEGWGEAGEFGLGDVAQRLPELEAGVEAAKPVIARHGPLEREAIEKALRHARVPSAVIAAIDQALWDWCGKRAGLPVWQLWGQSLSVAALPRTFVTVGIAEPAAAQERVRQWLAVGDVRAFKIKLGNPAGIRTDQAMFAAVREAIPEGSLISVDANGGWSGSDAETMCGWLADRGVDHVEQPLPRGGEAGLPALRRASPLPLLLDESVFSAANLTALAARGGFDGVNIKLMKCGGPSEALRMIAVAQALGLRTMIGCYYHTSLGNTAGAALGPLVDYLDLDSHLNLKHDPFAGASLVQGRLIPPDRPGFGVVARAG